MPVKKKTSKKRGKAGASKTRRKPAASKTRRKPAASNTRRKPAASKTRRKPAASKTRRKPAASKTRRKTGAAGRKKPAARKAARPKAAPKPKRKAKAKPRAGAAPRKAGGILETSRVTRHPNVASRTIDGQEVVIVPSSRKLQMLNEVATRIWALCDGRTVKEIVDAITSEYEVTRSTALRDVLDFVGEIRKRGMVEIA